MTNLAKHPVESTPAQARARSKAIQSLAKQVDSTLIKLAQRLLEGRDAHDYKALGFARMKDWLAEQLNGSMSVSYAMFQMRVIETLPFLPEKKILEMGPRNAGQLIRLPEKERHKPEWIDKAIAQNSEQFKETVEVALEKRTGMKRDTFVQFSISLPESVHEHLELAIAEIARVENLDVEQNPGLRIQCLDLMAALVLTELRERGRVEA
jgi:hypothetical protein